MKKRTFFISLFSTTILGIAGYIGYKTSQTDTPTNESHLSLNVINKDKPVNVELRDIVDSIQYTVLESSASCMLGEITRVKKTDGYYFVRDDFGLYAFDEEGHFINGMETRSTSTWKISISTNNKRQSDLSATHPQKSCFSAMTANIYPPYDCRKKTAEYIP